MADQYIFMLAVTVVMIVLGIISGIMTRNTQGAILIKTYPQP